jgi:hypothetical protein
MLILEQSGDQQNSDRYEPVRFMHSKHAGVLEDCSICHHRMPRGEGDTYGEPLTMDSVTGQTAPNPRPVRSAMPNPLSRAICTPRV